MIEYIKISSGNRKTEGKYEQKKMIFRAKKGYPLGKREKHGKMEQKQTFVNICSPL